MKIDFYCHDEEQEFLSKWWFGSNDVVEFFGTTYRIAEAKGMPGLPNCWVVIWPISLNWIYKAYEDRKGVDDWIERQRKLVT